MSLEQKLSAGKSVLAKHGHAGVCGGGELPGTPAQRQLTTAPARALPLPPPPRRNQLSRCLSGNRVISADVSAEHDLPTALGHLGRLQLSVRPISSCRLIRLPGRQQLTASANRMLAAQPIHPIQIESQWNALHRRKRSSYSDIYWLFAFCKAADSYLMGYRCRTNKSCIPSKAAGVSCIAHPFACRRSAR